MLSSIQTQVLQTIIHMQRDDLVEKIDKKSDCFEGHNCVEEQMIDACEIMMEPTIILPLSLHN